MSWARVERLFLLNRSRIRIFIMNTSVGKLDLFGDVAGNANQQLGELGAGGKVSLAEQIANFHG